ncbi:MAG TPA: 7,8-didemethyl-8-hydroxy-5-deazariboflavin synthase subunit CofG [Actinobacteria bacterium]|nr:7,8-didemethyl-8-hydroxy-5-deazariboflavin synthase subunit CofG [Actinomycetota bacterium]
MPHPAPDPELAAAYLDGTVEPGPLFAEAARLRDLGHGRTITYSRKVFVPLTTLCRDRCRYCTFAKPPGAGGAYLVPDEVLALVRAGERHGCTEALFTLGDRPEDRWPAARAFLEERGHASTLEYVAAMTELVFEETALLPHANPGLMPEGVQRRLRRSNPSLGLMLENVSPRLAEPGGPHHGAPDKDPARRIETIEIAGRLRIPFTSGVLVGIGERTDELVASLFALADLARKHGHLQEVIVQNFSPKADIPMRSVPAPSPRRFAVVVAVARWILGPTANVQAPPNLSTELGPLLAAGINDWGGVSPITIDWVNPEAPWPHLERLEAVTRDAGFDLRARLPVYPEYLDATWLEPRVLAKAAAMVGDDGLVPSPVAVAR